mmetsp:Transcript_17024/g.29460  ORF Transcript_17024/g.29460 Transcript_17024/m.29460 type:complete len:206 (+) Transcript_17024:137-754(+)
MVAPARWIAEPRDPFPLELQHSVRLRPCRDVDLQRAVHGLYGRPGAENSIQIGNLHIRVQVDAFALEHRVGLHRDVHVKVAWRPALWTGIALLPHPKPAAGIHSGGNSDAELLVRSDSAGAAARLAGRLHHLPAPLACGAWGDLGERSEGRASRSSNLAVASTRRACPRARARFCSGSLADRARLQMCDSNRLLPAKNRRLKLDL